MGWGDELMLTGEVARMVARDSRRVRVLYRGSVRRWHAAFNGNPRLARPEEEGNFQVLHNGPGERPYIAAKRQNRWTWRDYTPTPGEIYFSPYERAFAERYPGRIILEPNIKVGASPNKDWGWVRWNKLAWLLDREGYRVTQLGGGGQPMLDAAEFIQTPDFRCAAAVLSSARLAVLPEGGLHHAAAAAGTPAVVIFGGFISPAQTGYAGQINFHRGGRPCGMRVPCQHCARAMAEISPEEVFEAARGILRGDREAA